MLHIAHPFGHLVDAIKINANHVRISGNRVFCVKQRRKWSVPVAFFANLFFRAARNPVVVWYKDATWQAWEIESFTLLHAEEGYQAFADGNHAVWIEKLPGYDLGSALERGTLDDTMLAAAARELRRVHDLRRPELGGAWSHGDPNLGNFIFDPATDHARLIDFEVAHCPELTEVERLADDLLVFLQDMMGVIDGAHWLPTATCFLSHYDAAGPSADRVISCLKRRLVAPRGISRIWWAIRTSYLARVERDHRIDALREAIGKLPVPV